MNFDVAAPSWWTWLAVGTAVFFALFGWRDVNRRYAGNSLARFGLRIFVGVGAIALPFVVYGANAAAVRVRGQELEVRRDFERSFRLYTVGHASEFSIRRVKPRRGTSHDEIVITFRDGYQTEIHEDFNNYGRLLNYLRDQGIPQR